MGRPNAYPIPAHWPIQAKQQNWRERAEAFDAAAVSDRRLVTRLNDFLKRDVEIIVRAARKDVKDLAQALCTSGYKVPPSEDEYEEPPPRAPEPPPSPTRPLTRPTED